MRFSAVNLPGETFLEDQDLLPEDFNKAVRSGQLHNCVFVFSKDSMKSPVQLCRLGMIVKATPGTTMIPIVIGITFDFPDEDFLVKLQVGDVIDMGPNKEGKSFAQLAVRYAAE